MFNKLTLSALVASSVLLGGCTALNTASNSTFSCNGASDCPTPFEVYEGTHTSPKNVRNGRTPGDWGVKGVEKGRGFDDSIVNERGQKVNAGILDLTKVAANIRHSGEDNSVVMPIRQPSQIMRIWIAPWIDQSDNLNWSGYVYTEVTPKRWSFGEKEIRYQGNVPQFNPNFSSNR